MKAELKSKWVRALRSSAYSQGRGQLRDGHNRFCCLGVLLDQIDPEAWRNANVDEYTNTYVWRDGCVLTLTDDVLISVGLSGEQRHDLMQMNDVMGRSFELIADWIDQNL